MVWILTPLHASLGLTKYYFTKSGNYKVGRKGCEIVIQTDKTVSRLHAEIKVELVESKGSPEDLSSITRPNIVLRDLSKFGSFVNKSAGAKPVFSFPNKEIVLNEGDLITFGTDNSTFRLDYFSVLPHVALPTDKTRKDAVEAAVNSVGGFLIGHWCAECTHLLVEDSSLVTDVVIQAVAERKPVVGTGWIEAVASRSSISSEFPCSSRFTPNLQWKVNGDAMLLKIVEPDVRATTFHGFTFYVGSLYLYSYKNLLQKLVEASGGIVVPISEVLKSRVIQNSKEELNDGLLILPTLEPKIERWLSSEELKSVSRLRKTSETKLVAAILAGKIDHDSFEIPANPTVSASSDETVEASHSDINDSETISSKVVGEFKATSFRAPISTKGHVRVSSTRTKDVQDHKPSTASFLGSHQLSKSMVAPSTIRICTSNEDFKIIQKPLGLSNASLPEEDSADKKLNSLEENIADSKADIEYSKDLIVRKEPQFTKEDPFDTGPVQNFKRFRKKHAISGNSFATLIPFAKEPYRESDYNKEVQEYMQQEKKRKQAEALAEDLFNAEQLKRQKGAGTSGLLAVSSQQSRLGRAKAR